MPRGPSLKEGLGSLTARIIADSLSGALPGIGNLSELESLIQLRNGNLDPENVKRLTRDIKKGVGGYVVQVQRNPYFDDFSIILSIL